MIKDHRINNPIFILTIHHLSFVLFHSYAQQMEVIAVYKSHLTVTAVTFDGQWRTSPIYNFILISHVSLPLMILSYVFMCLPLSV